MRLTRRRQPGRKRTNGRQCLAQGEFGAGGSGGGSKDGDGLLLLEHAERRDPGLDYSRLFTRDLAEGAPEHIHVVEPNLADAADCRLEVVSGVPSAAKPRLQDDPFDPARLEADQRDGGELLEGRGATDRQRRRMHSCHGRHHSLAADERAVDPDTLAEDVQVRAGEESNADATLAKHPLAQRRRGALAVCAGDVDQLQRRPGTPQVVEHRLEAVPTLLWLLVPR